MNNPTENPVIIRYWSTHRYPLFLTRWEPASRSRYLPGSIQVYDWTKTCYVDCETDNEQIIQKLNTKRYIPLACRLVQNRFRTANPVGLFVHTFIVDPNGQRDAQPDLF